MDFNTVLNQWIDLASVYDKPQSNNLLNIIRQLNSRVKEAMDHDATGLSGIFILNNVLEDYLKNKKISLMDIVSDSSRFNRFLKRYNTLRKSIDDPEITRAWDLFVNAVEHSVKGMGLYTDKLQELLGDRYQMAQLRISSLVAAESLRIDQFSTGIIGVNDNQLFFGTDIFRFFDVNYMLKFFFSPCSA